MRIAPHVLYAGAPAEDLFERIVLDSISTHGHPRAILGALMFGSALSTAYNSREALTYGGLVKGARDGLFEAEDVMSVLPSGWLEPSLKSEYASEWNDCSQEARTLLDRVEKSLARGALSNTDWTLRDIGAADNASFGAGTITAAAAVYLASRSAVRPLHGLVESAFQRGADTDTLSSMTGTLLGAINGSGWLDGLSGVQDRAYMEKLARSLVGDGAPPAASSGNRSVEVLHRDLHRQIFNTDKTGRGTFPDGRLFQVTDRYRLTTNSADDDGRRVVLLLEDGQTVLVDRIEKAPRRTARQDGAGTRSRDQGQESRKPLRSEATPTTSRPIPDAKMTLLTSNFDDCVQYYSALTSRRVVGNGGIAEIFRGVFLVKTENASASDQEGFSITIRVRSLDQVSVNSPLQIAISGSGERFLEGRDPDGRLVLIEEEP